MRDFQATLETTLVNTDVHGRSDARAKDKLRPVTDEHMPETAKNPQRARPCFGDPQMKHANRDPDGSGRTVLVQSRARSETWIASLRSQ